MLKGQAGEHGSPWGHIKEIWRPGCKVMIKGKEEIKFIIDWVGGGIWESGIGDFREGNLGKAKSEIRLKVKLDKTLRWIQMHRGAWENGMKCLWMAEFYSTIR